MEVTNELNEIRNFVSRVEGLQEIAKAKRLHDKHLQGKLFKKRRRSLESRILDA